MNTELRTHKDSIRAAAIRLRRDFYGGEPTDDSAISIYAVEDLLKNQFLYVLNDEDMRRQKAGARIDSWRLQSRIAPIELATDGNGAPYEEQNVFVPEYISWHGYPYVSSVESCITTGAGGVIGRGIKFMRVNERWQLQRKSAITGRPTYCIDGTGMNLWLTPDTISVENLLVTGALKDPFYGLERNDPAFWLQPWQAGMRKAEIEERVARTLQGEAVATYRRHDKRNDGVETPVNN